jgi:hypothetical protein
MLRGKNRPQSLPGWPSVGLWLVGIACIWALGYGWGHRSAGIAAGGSELREQLALERQRSAQLEQQLVNRMLAAEVDWRSMEQVRRLVAELDQRILDQEEELNLYRLLLQQDGSVKGLHIEHWRATPAADPGVYDYRLVVRQNVDLSGPLEVSLKVVLLGEAGGAATTFTLAELDEGVDREVVPLSFRYFKFFDGRLTLPAGFVPREVEVSVWPRGKREDVRVRRFRWGDTTAPGAGGDFSDRA